MANSVLAGSGLVWVRQQLADGRDFGMLDKIKEDRPVKVY